MRFEEVHIDAYDSFFKTEASIFLTAHYYKNNTPASEINSLRCFVGAFKEGSIGIVGLQNGNVFQSPYLAPYGGLRSDGNLGYAAILNFVEKFKEAVFANGGRQIKITLAPTFQEPDQITLETIVLKSIGFQVSILELNQHFCLHTFSPTLSYLDKKERSTLKTALKRKFRIELLTNTKDRLALYDMLAVSRQKRNIPLKLSAEKLIHISTFVQMDFWAVYASDAQLCAGAVVYHALSTTPNIIYWGFDPDYAEANAMRVLAYQLFGYYSTLGKKYVDIGISTDRGIPNQNLIAFKENIGCVSSLRTEMVLDLDSKASS